MNAEEFENVRTRYKCLSRELAIQCGLTQRKYRHAIENLANSWMLLHLGGDPAICPSLQLAIALRGYGFTV